MDSKQYPEHMVFGLDIGTRSVVGTVGYKQNEHNFTVVAQSVRYHETRAMLDGQIHDIGRVAETIQQVKRELERQIDRKLTDVCIAAAGRVLKTVTIHADYELGGDVIITDEHIHSLELIGVEKGYEAIRKETQGEETIFYCVGYTVVRYYLNNNMMLNLESHKGSKISADVLATFLPEEVIEGLYAAVEKAGLQVVNLTLEPIAAINIAIPEKFRLLNIALVDVGAGTSDICITKEGTITAYGMIPRAGDEITNVIVQNHLVDFAMAEKIKLSVGQNNEAISYEDIIGLPSETTSEEILKETYDVVFDITSQIAERIKELNGNKGVSAVFVVGGGGKLPSFTTALAKHLELPKERVALRGEEVLGSVQFVQPEIKKDPLLVTPIGICLNYYEQKNSFVYVQVNGERVKLYDNSKLTIVDAAMGIGFPNEWLFPRRGASINFTLNGAKRMIRGEAGEAAQILLNGKIAGINAAVVQNDIIEIKPSTVGEDAVYEVRQLPEYNGIINFIVNDKKVSCPKFIVANKELVSGYYSIKDGDELQILNYYTLKQVLEFMDIICEGTVYVNHEEADMDEKVYENFTVTCTLAGQKEQKDLQIEYNTANELEIEKDKIQQNDLQEDNEEKNDIEQNRLTENKSQELNRLDKTKKTDILGRIDIGKEPITLHVFVNKTPVVLNGKPKYRLVDVLDVYPFDLSTVKGSSVVIAVNNEKADFTKEIKEGDMIDMYWVK